MDLRLKLKTLMQALLDRAHLWVLLSLLQQSIRGGEGDSFEAASELSGRGSMMHSSSSSSSSNSCSVACREIPKQQSCTALHTGRGGCRSFWEFYPQQKLFALRPWLDMATLLLQPSANQFLQVIPFLPHDPSRLSENMRMKIKCGKIS